LTTEEYLDRADPWPLNPNGELLLGVKLEVANADEILKTPGIAFAEWGPGDMALSLGVRGSGQTAPRHPAMQKARATILAACKANKKFFLNPFGPDDVIDRIKEGVMIGPASRETAEKGPHVHQAGDALVIARKGTLRTALLPE
jgi:4-hydroxy-2-oxoheptanedioate aldolase